MTIVVTGAAGFVGTLLIERLLEGGAQVVAVDRDVSRLPRHLPALRSISGDIDDRAVVQDMFSLGCSAVVHLATVPGGAAEADPAASRHINVDAMYDLLLAAADSATAPRIVYASSIAVLGDPLPASGVDDTTPVAPRMIYGGHKAMMEVALAMMTHRGMVDGVGIRLPGILARPPAPSGMKSAFMSDIFHALRRGEPFTCPVSSGATIWAQSVDQCVTNFLHALQVDGATLPTNRTVTLPAMRFSMGELAAEIARQSGVSASLVRFEPDAQLEAAFGSYPPLATPAAEEAGFRHDGTLATLVERALTKIASTPA